jgi:hypothetical protein
MHLMRSQKRADCRPGRFRLQAVTAMGTLGSSPPSRALPVGTGRSIGRRASWRCGSPLGGGGGGCAPPTCRGREASGRAGAPGLRCRRVSRPRGSGRRREPRLGPARPGRVIGSGGETLARCYKAREIERLHLPDYLIDFVRFAYYSGWRKSEIKKLEWRDVQGDVIRLRPEVSKN